VFIHGNSSSPYIFNEIMDSNKLLYTLVAIELPGHNKDDKTTDVNRFSTKNYCKELTTFIDSLEDDIFLIGNSLGGHLAIEIASKIKNLNGLMTFGTPPVKKPINFEEAFHSVPALQTFLTENPKDEDIWEAAEVAVFNKKHAKVIARDFKNSNPLVRKALLTDLTNGNWTDQYSQFLKLDVPKFIVEGEQDPTVNSDYLNALNNYCSTNCQIIKIDDCGHYPSLEQPENLIEIIDDASKSVFSL